MKRYKAYMDGVEPSPRLRERLLGLTAEKTPVWRKYGAAAAAVALAVGVGLFGVSRLGGNTELGNSMPAETQTAIGEIAIAPGGYPGEGGPPKTMGGYEVSQGEVVSYYMLPYIAYGDSVGGSMASIAVPEEVTQRDLTEEEIRNLLGGEGSIVTHLNWGGCELYGYVMSWPDGSVWRAHLFGKREGLFFDLAMCPDELPLDYLVGGGNETVTDVWGVEVVGYRGGIYGEGTNREVWLPESRGVEFLAKGVGCRFVLFGEEGQAEQVTKLVSRFVRLAVTEGLELDALTPGWEPAVGGEILPPGTVGEASTPAYDPNGT